jgi:hypothetical protein
MDPLSYSYLFIVQFEGMILFVNRDDFYIWYILNGPSIVQMFRMITKITLSQVNSAHFRSMVYIDVVELDNSISVMTKLLAGHQENQGSTLVGKRFFSLPLCPVHL